MYSSFLEQFLTARAVTSFCWTLVHSLWIGLLMALAAGLVIILTGKSAPKLRYSLLSGLFLLFLIAIVSTFVRQWQEFQPVTKEVTVGRSTPAGQVSNLKIVPTVQESSGVAPGYIDRIVEYLNSHGSLLVTIWFIVFSARLVRVLSNIVYIERIRHHKTLNLSGTYWASRTRELARLLQIKVPIQILESEMIKAPLTAGYFKPVILFPLSMLSQLPPDEVEAVLLHELAHIRRKDYLVNLLQGLTEAIFFFNPAVLWVSSLIRDERENCCDEIAIGITNNRKTFVQALVAFQEYSFPISKGALAFWGRKNHLLNRVRRIMTNCNSTLDGVEKALLATGLILFGFLTLNFSQASQSPGPRIQIFGNSHSVPAAPTDTVPSVKKQVDSVPAIEKLASGEIPATAGIAGEMPSEDSLPKLAEITRDNGTNVIQTNWEGKKYRIVEAYDNAFGQKPGARKSSDFKVTALYIDGRKIPNEQIPSYMPVIEKIRAMAITQMEQQAAMLKIDQMQLEFNQDQLGKDQTQLNSAIAELKERQAALMNLQQLQAEKDQGQLNQEHVQLEKELALLQQQRAEMMARDEQLRKEMGTNREGNQKMKEDQVLKLTDQIRLQAEMLKLKEIQMNDLRMQIPFEFKPDPASPWDPVPPVEGGLVKPAIPPAPSLTMDKSVLSIIGDLKMYQIIQDDSRVSFTLNNQELVVNGKKQPRDIFLRFKSKYIKGPKDHFICSLSKNSSHTDIYIQ